MKTKVVLLVLAGLLVLAFALGAAGLIKLYDENAPEHAGRDRLIGVFVTTGEQDVFDEGELDDYLAEHLTELIEGKTPEPEDYDAYRGRIYAKLVDTPYVDEETGETRTYPEYVFEGSDGIRFFRAVFSDENGNSSRGVSADDRVSDVNQSIHATDEGENYEITGTVYLSSAEENEMYVNVNPVYQTPDGAVYAVRGDSYAMGSGDWWVKLEESGSFSSGGEKTTNGFSVELHFCSIEPAREVVILQFDGGSELLDSKAFLPDALPESITPLPGAQYLIVESRTLDGVSREIYERDDEDLYVFVERENSVCARRSCEIRWN